jgi:acetylornithine/succinyldiaminopimelate/putrescine aminotransferase
VLRFEPPLIINAEQVDFAVEAVDGAIAETVEMLAELT